MSHLDKAQGVSRILMVLLSTIMKKINMLEIRIITIRRKRRSTNRLGTPGKRLLSQKARRGQEKIIFIVNNICKSGRNNIEKLHQTKPW